MHASVPVLARGATPGFQCQGEFGPLSPLFWRAAHYDQRTRGGTFVPRTNFDGHEAEDGAKGDGQRVLLGIAAQKLSIGVQNRREVLLC